VSQKRTNPGSGGQIARLGSGIPASREDVSRAAALRRHVIFLERVEIAWTVALDVALLAVAIGIRHLLVGLIHWVDEQGEYNWLIGTVEKVADYGLLGTMIIITVFDLLKRAKHAGSDIFKR